PETPLTAADSYSAESAFFRASHKRPRARGSASRHSGGTPATASSHIPATVAQFRSLRLSRTQMPHSSPAQRGHLGSTTSPIAGSRAIHRRRGVHFHRARLARSAGGKIPADGLRADCPEFPAYKS